MKITNKMLKDFNAYESCKVPQPQYNYLWEVRRHTTEWYSKEHVTRALILKYEQDHMSIYDPKNPNFKPMRVCV